MGILFMPIMKEDRHSFFLYIENKMRRASILPTQILSFEAKIVLVVSCDTIIFWRILFLVLSYFQALLFEELFTLVNI